MDSVCNNGSSEELEVKARTVDHDINQADNTKTNPPEELMTWKRRSQIFGDCALIEIIHLHDCLRGALESLAGDVDKMTMASVDIVQTQQEQGNNSWRKPQEYLKLVSNLERQVAGRFQVIWSVFRAHSSAEDEFIWPALRLKMRSKEKASSEQTDKNNDDNKKKGNSQSEGDHGAEAAPKSGNGVTILEENDDPAAPDTIEQEEYEEDHADEERMFSEMNTLLNKLRQTLILQGQEHQTVAGDIDDRKNSQSVRVNELSTNISDCTRSLSQHLLTHLLKEETECMPLVVKHLSKSEIQDLVGKIMGKRSADTIKNIMSMAVDNLDKQEREEMVQIMKESMAGTFFDRWLQMSGTWMSTPSENEDTENEKKRAAVPIEQGSSSEDETLEGDMKRPRVDTVSNVASAMPPRANSSQDLQTDGPLGQDMTRGVNITSQAELERLVRAVACNKSLSSVEKQTTIQGLRDSVWRSNQRQRNLHTVTVNAASTAPLAFAQQTSAHNATSIAHQSAVNSSITSRTRRCTHPSMYFVKTKGGKTELVWRNSTATTSSAATSPSLASSNKYKDSDVPLFSTAELAPTYHDGAAGSVLGCPHYARACKLRHPKSGRLYTCRLCCEQQQEIPSGDPDEPLDRYAVTEVMCMKCNALQPAGDRCINPDCESWGKPFANYFCRICHLYDDSSRPIYHCPYCNTCRLGAGLGIDYRHCMQCNACVSLEEKNHQCIPQKLQGNCPICHESMFQSTEPLRGLKCGHVMHLKCFTQYRRSNSYTCPTCRCSMEDMTHYFSLLDAAVRMQPMPVAYLHTMSNILCQDCEKTGQVQYHFVGQKCPHCGSYNTRELGRVQNAT